MVGWIIGVVFAGVYFGMAIGRLPGLAVDRTGVALVGAIVLFVSGAADAGQILRSVDFATIAILFSLMVLSSLFAASGFFEWCAAKVAAARVSPRMLLALVIGVSGGLSSVLTNDIVVWAITPVLVEGLVARRLDPRPYVIALACAANAGSAATLIGNPQNLLIGQYSALDFWTFTVICGVPAVVSLALVFVVIAALWRGKFQDTGGAERSMRHVSPALAPRPLAKAVIATAALIAVFTFSQDRATWTLGIAGILLLSRSLSTRRMLSMVDWHLLLLFACLFVVTGALAETGAPQRLLARLGEWVAVDSPAVLLVASLAGSNTVGNVPLVVLVLSAVRDIGPASLHALAVFSTLSGNFLIIGSLANIIAVERSRAAGVTIGFVEYAQVGVPMTALSLLAAYLWLALVS